MSDPTQMLELWDIDKIRPYPGNAKKHPPEQIQKLAVSIEKLGWTAPIIIEGDGTIIAGHGRRLAAIELGRTRVPVIVRRDLSKVEADALRLADNRIVSTDYDTEIMQAELQRLSAELDGAGFELTDLGFDLKEIEFVTADLGFMDDSLFVEDVTEAVETQKAENADRVEGTDEAAAPVVDALGFKRVSIAQSRAIRELMSRFENDAGEPLVEEFIAVLRRGLEG